MTKKSRLSTTLTEQSYQIDTQNLPLPSIIRYFDDFSGRDRTIRSGGDVWKVVTDGAIFSVNWLSYNTLATQLFLKKFISWTYGIMDPTSVASMIGTINREFKLVEIWIGHLSRPNTAKTTWENHGYNQMKENVVTLLRKISMFMSEMSLSGWSPDDAEYLRGWNWFSPNKVSSVEHENGYYFTLEEEKSLVSYFESLASLAHKSQNLEKLRDSLLVYVCYQFGMRPIQIAAVTRTDVSVLEVSDGHAVHVTFHKAKQKKGKAPEPMLRKIKRSWTPIFSRYIELDKLTDLPRSDLVKRNSLFNLTPSQTSNSVIELSQAIIGRSISPTLFRHIAAQRMADLGMSQIALAEFMGHSHEDTCLIYFENSAHQGSIINAALGLSKVYNKVKKMTNKDFISKINLKEMPEDQQVGGAAHGIALAGIGGCAIGQSLCELSPAISCYTCPKFLPLHDVNVHNKVAEELREVISSFVSAGRNDESNPAFAQLKNTMHQVTRTISALEVNNEQ